MRDRLIAFDEFVPREVPDPISLGALRPANSKLTWRDEAIEAAKSEVRAVLSGDISNLDEVVRTIEAIQFDFPGAKFALLIHAVQALSVRPQPGNIACFESVYVATAENLDPADIREISIAWSPKWVLIPNSEINKADWIPNFLLPNRQGKILLFAPRFEPDELRLQLDEFAFEHPLIEISPAPHEWFVPTQLGPERIESRNPNRAKLVQDSRSRDDYSLSVIVPFRWTGEVANAEMMVQSLKSIADTFASDERCEILIAVDRSRECESLTAQTLKLDLADTAYIDVERVDDEADWRAGFIRNCGASFARNRTGFLLFIDADVAISATLELSRAVRASMIENAIDLVQLSDFPDRPAFETASSSLLLIRRSLFAQLGGFSGAFSNYGCEDNFLIWGASLMRAQIKTLPNSTVRHLRPRVEADDLVAKMIRLRPSADLMYRMTLDPSVHRLFFSALGNDLWWRALLKRAAGQILSRALLAPFVFFLTLIETRNRIKYVVSFVEVFTWKVRGPLLWLRSNSWRAAQISHAWRANAWKLPNFFISHYGAFRVSLERRIISLRASRFGWNAISWRVKVWSKIVSDQIRWRASVARIRFAGASLWLLTSIVSLFSNIHWLLTVGVGRLIGQFLRGVGEIRRALGEVRRAFGELYRLFVIYVLVPLVYLARRPAAFWQLHGWRVSKVVGDLKGEAWVFRAPTEWFKVRVPRFYKWFWRPLLKVRYFLEYHLITRWRNT
jgi:hypothetical protein